MAVSSDYLAWVVEQLNRVSTVTARRMFGGAGLYADGCFFAVVDTNTVYFRTGPDNVSQYQSRGIPAFRPPGFPPMKYHQVPAEILELPEFLREWVRAAVAEAAAA
jgi:DNA transformation protein